MSRKNPIVADRDNWQRDANRLRATNAKLLSALEECYRILSTGSYHAAPATAQARAAIEEARK